ncbi:MAG TPA: glycosyltransferase family 2 protein [Rhodospirillales bacterium]|nr:glycosyltransferase family 2 protein [Rhodospirillales bacterium]
MNTAPDPEMVPETGPEASQAALGPRPRVSIGLPVYNGENYMAAAIEGVLNQTFSDLELIVCDDASTDRTAEICREYMARDNRIRYHRNERNRGAAPNYNNLVRMARGEYFKWIAHDDVITPDYLAKTVDALDRRPEAVLAHSRIRVIDKDAQELTVYENALPPTAGGQQSQRFAGVVLDRYAHHAFFGLIRVDALRKTPLHKSYAGGDRALVVFLALLGPFVHIPEPLYWQRHHPDRYYVKVSARERAAWHDRENTMIVASPLWHLYRELIWGVRTYVPDRDERMRCYRHLAHWWSFDLNGVRVAVELVEPMAPWASSVALRVKRFFAGSKDEALSAEEHRK